MPSLRLPATLDCLDSFRDMVRQSAQAIAPGLNTGMLEMALEELLVNVVNYAYPDGPGDINVETGAGDGALTIAITDSGVPYDPTTETAAPDLEADIEDRAIGGLGVFLAQQIFASMNYRRAGNTNVLELTYRPSDSAAR